MARLQNRRRTAVAAAAVTVAFGMVGLARTGAAAQAPRHHSAAAKALRHVSAHATMNAVDPLANRMSSLGHSKRYSRIFGGVVETNNQTHVNVYLTKLSQRSEADYSAAASNPQTVSYVKARTSLRALTNVHDRVTAAFHSLKLRGVRLGRWYPVIQTGREHIDVIGLTPAGKRTLNRRFGAANIHVSGMTSRDRAVPTATRDNDDTPRHGGDAIQTQTTPGGGCSSAFPVTVNGHGGMLSASHCFNGADQFSDVVNVLETPTKTDGSTQNRLGGFEDRETGSGAGDAAVFNTNKDGGSSHKIWTGVIGSPSLTDVAGSTANAVGSSVCNEGAYSGEICDLTVENNDTCLTFSGFRKECHLVEAQRCSSCIANQAGDSGGPIVKFVLGDVLAAGIDSGVTDVRLTVPCQHNATTCYSTLLYTAMTWTLNSSGLGVTLNTN
jgi:hypothetical protein